MFEYMEKYKWATRTSTLKTIDKPLQAFLGLTYMDLVFGVVAGFVALLSIDSLFSVIAALASCVSTAFVSKKLSTAFPRKVVSHTLFSLGLSGLGKMKNIFKKRRFVVLSP